MFNLLAKPAKAPAQEIEISHDGQQFRIALKRMAAARRMTLRVRAASRDILLTMPKSVGLRQAQEFAQNHAGWIAERLARLPQQAPFAPGAKIPLRGVDHVLRHRAEKTTLAERRGPVWIEAEGNPPMLCVGGDPAHFERRISDFLRREAKKDLEKAVKRHAATIGLSPTALSLRDTSSRWGSCSAKGALNFSWRLILAPPFVLDYLAAHETAHLRHHNHSDKFWALTASLCPTMDRAEAWLKANGAQLHRYGRRPKGKDDEAQLE